MKTNKIIDFLGVGLILTLVLIPLKLFIFENISWWWITSPLWFPIVISIGVWMLVILNDIAILLRSLNELIKLKRKVFNMEKKK